MEEEEIKILNSNEFEKGVEIINKYWNKDYGNLKCKKKDVVTCDNVYQGTEKILELTTGGWSENEEIIDQIADTMFWFLWWQKK